MYANGKLWLITGGEEESATILYETPWSYFGIQFIFFLAVFDLKIDVNSCKLLLASSKLTQVPTFPLPLFLILAVLLPSELNLRDQNPSIYTQLSIWYTSGTYLFNFIGLIWEASKRTYWWISNLSSPPTWNQFYAILVPASTDPNGLWDNCKSNITNCSPSQLQIMEGNPIHVQFDLLTLIAA